LLQNKTFHPLIVLLIINVFLLYIFRSDGASVGGSLPNVSDTPNTAGEEEEGGASENEDGSSPNLEEMLNPENVRPGQQQEGKYKCI
jgi:hypothetical protein